jgi:hypothetical protein
VEGKGRAVKGSVFGDLSPAQVHFLKSQYLASLEMLDQEEADLKSQLAGLAKARVKVEELMRDLDQALEGPASLKVSEAAAPLPRKSQARRGPNPAARERSPG